MKDDLLEEFKNDYVDKSKRKHNYVNELKVLMKRKAIMENSTIVKDYIQLNSQIDTLLEKSHFDYDFVKTLSILEDKGLMSETNEIYVYNGTFYMQNNIVVRVHKNNPCGKFDKYIDIESMDEIEVPVEDRLVFEKNHKIVPLDGLEPTKYFLYSLRSKFIEDSLREGQEVACKKILSRNKKNL